jgi:hypothetical protein
LHGFKRGKDAFIPAGKRYNVFVNGQAVIKSTEVRTPHGESNQLY